jgi:dipeptidyl aminopeptidase/acylaminoacyl peptidase
MTSRTGLRLLDAALIAMFLVLLSTALYATSETAPSSRAESVLNSMPRTQRIGDVSISPDGALVAYSANEKLFIAPVAGGPSVEISVEGGLRLRDLAWSADSRRIVFIADLPGEVPSAQVWTAASDGGAMTKHAELKGYVESPRFSPDGSKVAVLFIQGIPRIAGPLQPMTPLAGEIGEKTYEQRIATIDLSDDYFAQLTPADMYVYEYEWTPDGKNWIVIAAHGAGDANWYLARIYSFNAQSGEMREIYKPKYQIARAHVSADGKTVAFIEGLMSDEGSTGGDVFIIPTGGGAARDVTPNIKSSPSRLAWTGPEQITFAEDVDGSSGFAVVDTKTERIQTLWTGDELTRPSAAFWVADGDKNSIALVRQSSNMAPEVWAGGIGHWKQITRLNDAVKPNWGEMRKVHWMNGNLRIQGWLMLPKDFTPAKQYPLVVNVHGGPSAACVNEWSERSMAAESAMGYFALCPNPRGSYGQGERFTRANVKDFGGGDFRDIMAGIDALWKEYPIDGKRLGIRGHSYGGYMTMWAETQTHRFAVAVAGAGLSDWLSYYGVNDIDEWMIPFFGASIYDDPAVYAKSDPMHFVKAVKTPTLILVGDRDGEVPTEQSVEWWHALQALRVPAKLIVYANEGHMMKPADARNYELRALDWLQEWFEREPQSAAKAGN